MLKKLFLSTGKGYVADGADCCHFMRDFNMIEKNYKNSRGMALLKYSDDNFSTLAFCRRWIDDLKFQKHYSSLKSFVGAGIVDPYPPLVDILGSYVSQFEHTILLRPTRIETLSFEMTTNLDKNLYYLQNQLNSIFF